MENPTLYLPLVLTIIGAIVWLLRLEAKVNGVVSTATDLSKDFYAHYGDRTVHHDADELNRRFNEINIGMGEIKKGVEKLNDRFDNLLAR